MTATLQSPEIDVRSPEHPGRRPGTEIERPPTMFGKDSPWQLVVAGHAAARRAIGFALEQVGLDAATDILRRTYSRDELRMAFHFLAWTRFDVALSEQVNALFLIEDALNHTERVHRRSRLAALAAEAADKLRERWDRVRSGLGSGSATPSGLAPAC